MRTSAQTRAYRNTLKRRAEESAMWREHKLGYWKDRGNTSAYVECLKCGMTIQVNTNPPANGIDIGGEAVALNCGDPTE